MSVRGEFQIFCQRELGAATKHFAWTNVKADIHRGALGNRHARRPEGHVRVVARVGAWPRAWPGGNAFDIVQFEAVGGR